MSQYTTVPIGKYTAANRNAFAVYKEAVKVLRMPLEDRKPYINSHESSELLAAEVTRVWRSRQAQKSPAI